MADWAEIYDRAEERHMEMLRRRAERRKEQALQDHSDQIMCNENTTQLQENQDIPLPQIPQK